MSECDGDCEYAKGLAQTGNEAFQDYCEQRDRAESLQKALEYVVRVYIVDDQDPNPEKRMKAVIDRLLTKNI